MRYVDCNTKFHPLCTIVFAKSIDTRADEDGVQGFTDSSTLVGGGKSIKEGSRVGQRWLFGRSDNVRFPGIVEPRAGKRCDTVQPGDLFRKRRNPSRCDVGIYGEPLAPDPCSIYQGP